MLTIANKTFNDNPVFIGFVTSPAHTEPGNFFTIGGELRIAVITEILTCYVYCLPCCYIIEVNIRVGAGSLLGSVQFTAGVGDFISVGTPANLFIPT